MAKKVQLEKIFFGREMNDASKFNRGIPKGEN
jgi:hypothetical protein